jgi:hypothetical protein
MFIPLLAEGRNLFSESHVPTDREMETLPIIDSATHLFAISPPLACRNDSSLYAA